MHDHVAVIEYDPAVACEALPFPLFFMTGADIFQGGIGERVDHTVARAAADDEVVGKRHNIF